MKERSETLTNLAILAVLIAGSFLFWESVKVWVILILTLGVLIAIHEWGHLIAAKAAGVHVYEFALGFGPKLLTYMRRGGTEYTIRAIPLGGFVNPKGMQPDDPITPDGINGRRPAERMLVYLSGPLMNMILAVVVLMLLGWLCGTPDESKVLVGTMDKRGAGRQMEVLSVNGGTPPSGVSRGLRPGDRVLEVNGIPVDSAETLVTEIHGNTGNPVTVKVQRGSDTIALQGTPRARTLNENWLVVSAVPPGSQIPVQPGDQISLIDGKLPGSRTERPDVAAERLLREKAGETVTLTLWRGGDTQLKLNTKAAPLDIEIKKAERTVGVLGFSPHPGQGPRVSFGESIRQGGEMVRNLAFGFARIFSRPKELGNNVGGVVAIGGVLGDVVRLPALYYFQQLAALSFSLAVFNLLPIPILDGGHVTILAVEVLRRRRLSPESQKLVALFGLAVIGILFVLITSNDIRKLILG